MKGKISKEELAKQRELINKAFDAVEELADEDGDIERAQFAEAIDETIREAEEEDINTGDGYDPGFWDKMKSIGNSILDGIKSFFTAIGDLFSQIGKKISDNCRIF